MSRLLLLCFVLLMAGAAPAADADHLLISEIIVKTRNPVSLFGSPYIQLVNPTAEDLEMGQVYLSDGTTAPTAFYYNLTLNEPDQFNPGGGNGGDFHARFPDGYVLAAGDSLAISLNGSLEYEEAFGRLPDFELFEDGLTLDFVPELLEVYPGSINAGPLGGSNVPVLSDIAESLILYTWDGSADLVQDLDYLLWGSNTGVRIDKTDITIGSQTYLPDTAVLDQESVGSAGPGFRHSFRRLGFDEGSEILTDGNGISGHDETSENLASTWVDVDFSEAGSAIPSAPASLFPAAPVFMEAGYTPNLPYEGQAVLLEVSLLSPSPLTGVNFQVSYDGGDYTVLPAAEVEAGLYQATVPAQLEGTVVQWFCEAENSGGGLAVHPAGAPRYASGWVVDELPDPAFQPIKLLITEVCVLGTSEEFVEIHNPQAVDVDMSNYYLGDAVYQSQGYWMIGAGADPITTGGGIFSDFQARFPDGFILAAGDTVVVSIAGSLEFSAAFGFLPHLELFEDDWYEDTVPDMRPIFETNEGNSIVSLEGEMYSIPSLTNSGESLALYHWIEGDDLVTDIDIFIWGIGGSYSINKTGVMVGQSTYLPDNPNLPLNYEPSFGTSFTRINVDQGFQIPTGSNGVNGQDETSENLLATFGVETPSPARGSDPHPIEGAWQDIWPAIPQSGQSVAHAWGDVDRDGDDDLYLVHEETGFSNQLFMNQSGGYFWESTPPGVADVEATCVAAWADAFNQKDLDLFVGRSSGPNICYYQHWFDEFDFFYFGFSDGAMLQENQTTAAAWIDVDHDGMLEVYVANEDSPDQLLSSRYGFYDFLPPELDIPAGSTSFAWCDYDLDWDPDLALNTSDGQLHILTNQGEDGFTGAAYALPAMSPACAWADADNDGDFDLVVALESGANLLWRNHGDFGFAVEELPQPETPTSCQDVDWGDFDNDGDQDLVFANSAGGNYLLRNDSDFGFTALMDDDLSSGDDSRATSWSDVDNDGDLDLFVSGNPNNQLMRNNLNNGNTFLKVRLSGNGGGFQSNISAVGALVKIVIGDQIQWRSVPGDGSTKEVHFGLGTAASVDEITVYWPFKLMDGQHHTSQLQNVAANQELEIGESWLGMSEAPENQVPVQFQLLPCHPNPFNPLTTLMFETPQAGPVDLEVFDLAGRRVRVILTDRQYAAGKHSVVWDGRGDSGRVLASGVYQVRMRAGEYEGVVRATLIK